MLKGTIKFTVYCVVGFICGCSGEESRPSVLEIQHYQDSLSEARIDSAYMEIRKNCDTLMVYQVPNMVDSLLKDSVLVFRFFDRDSLYSDADKKVEKVIRQLQADCHSSLLKETYRRALLRQRPKPVRRKKSKA